MDEVWLAEMAQTVERELEAGRIRDKDGLHKVKSRIAKAAHAPRLPQDPELLPYLTDLGRKKWGALLKKKPMRSQSGVAIIAVMSSPAGCPHGKCIYCPGGPEVNSPQSYTGFEPSTMRAKRHGYDPYRVVRSRLWQLQNNGHEVDKLEIVVQGGTFPAREEDYQDHFIAGIYAACNDGPEEHPEPYAAWEPTDVAERTRRLEELQRINETADCRVIGLTIETKPDWCLEPHIDAMLRHGATRIELGIQTLSDEITKLTNRGHTVQDAADAMRIARDAGLKLCVHMMPGLPRPTDKPGHYATDKDADIEDMRELFEGEPWKPDMLKIYPTLIVEEGETTLKKWWKEGRFEPLDTAGAVDVVAESLRHVPEHCRIQRIDRDIPTTHVVAGVQNSNLRQLAEAEAAKRGIKIREIRAREVGTRTREGATVSAERVELVRRDHQAGGGLEAFLSLEDPEADALVGFLRLRKVGQSHRPEFQDADGVAVVRELKVYGIAQALGTHDDPETGAWQHQGYGKQLLAEAERIAKEWGVGKLLVIAGAGVKQYYRRHGYEDVGPYVAKSFS